MKSGLRNRGVKALARLVDEIPLEKRVRNEKVARVTFLAPKEIRERRKLAKVLTGPGDVLFRIDPTLGFTAFDWPDDQMALVKQAIQSTQEAKRADSWSGKSYFRSLRSLKDYSVNSPEFKLATSPEMLKSVALYLGRLPVLLDISARVSLAEPDKPGQQFSGSQLFHRDMDDVASVKVWILCSDVASENGPTVLLPSRLSHQIAREVSYRQGDKISDDRIFQSYQDDFFEAVGRVGSSYATDTCSSFHYGSRVRESKERLVLYFQYVSSTSVYFRPLGERAGSRRKKFFQVGDPTGLTEAQRILMRGYI